MYDKVYDKAFSLEGTLPERRLCSLSKTGAPFQGTGRQRNKPQGEKAVKNVGISSDKCPRTKKSAWVQSCGGPDAYART